MSGDIKDNTIDDSINTEYREETWGKNVDGEYVTDGFKFRGKQPFKKAKEELEKLLLRGAQFEVGNTELIVLDARNKGIELEVDIQMNDKEKDNNRGVAIVKLYGPNKRKENTVTITKSKQSDIKFVTLMAQKVIKPLIKTFLGKEDGEKVKELSKPNDCEYCEKSFKTVRGLRGHVAKKHKAYLDISKETINLSTTETEILLVENQEQEFETNLEEDLNIKEEKIYTSKCSTCENLFETTRKYELIKKLLKHKETCGTSKVRQNPKLKYCPTCQFEVKDELHLKRHRRDKHDILTDSTSPPPKKTKMSRTRMQTTEEKMDIDESIQEEMDVDNHDEQNIRSMLMDRKIEAKAKKLEEEERLINDKKKKVESEKKAIEALEIEKNKQSIKKRKQRIKNEKKKSRSSNQSKKNESNIPNVKPVPKNISHLCKAGDKIYTVPGDGACGANSIAAHLFRDEVFGPKLRKKINDFKVKHWDKKYKFKTQCSVESPFVRRIGLGGEISFTDPEKLFSYLKNDVNAEFMWTECEDLIIVADMFQVKIKVIKTKGESDENPFVAWFEPDIEMKAFAELENVKIDEIVLLNENESHFNLIISENNELAITGSLSFMSNIGPLLETNELEKTKSYAEAVGNGSNVEESSGDTKSPTLSDIECLKKALQKSNEKVKALEKQYDECEAALVKMAEEFEKQKSELKDLKAIVKLEKEVEEASRITSFKATNKNSQNIEIPGSNEDLNTSYEMTIDREFNCLECGFQGTEQSQLDKHILLKHRIQCRNCEKVFKTKPDFMVHRKTEHYRLVALCRKGDDCQFKNRCWWKHEAEEGNSIQCFFCETEFATKGEVMMHRKSYHGRTVKTCEKFIIKSCSYTEETCWFKHEITELKESNTSNENNSVFRKRQRNPKSP